jgi:GntR family histidine utilization transcriptional repressor
MTVNKALSNLVGRGLIERRRRAGSFVAAPRVHRATLDIPDIRDDVLARGMRYRLELEMRQERPAEADDGLQGAGLVLALGCTHFGDERPYAIESRLINLEAVPAARSVDFGREPAGAWLLGHVPWTDARHRITAIAADADSARRLRLATGTACLSLERWTWRGDAGITSVRLLHPGDRYDLAARFLA